MEELQKTIEHVMDDYYDPDAETFNRELAAKDIVEVFQSYLSSRDKELIEQIRNEETIVPVLDSGNPSEYHEGFNDALDTAISLIQGQGEKKV